MGNLRASASGVRSRFVLVVECMGLVARAVAVRLLEGFGVLVDSSGSESLAESIMLSSSPSEPLTGSSSSSSCTAAASCSSF